MSVGCKLRMCQSEVGGKSMATGHVFVCIYIQYLFVCLTSLSMFPAGDGTRTLALKVNHIKMYKTLCVKIKC